MRVVVLLAGHDRSVDDLAKNMQQSQSVMSRHLRILAQAGVVVRSPREGRVFYKLTEDVVVRRIIDAALE